MKRLLVPLVASVLVLTGCVPAAQNTGEVVSAELAPFYHQSLDWSACYENMQCAEVTVPLDWANPDIGDVVSLALVRHKATGSKEGSLLVNPGGPGGSGANFIAESLDYAVSPELQERYDIVGFDPRGVGSSSAVRCLNAAEMDSYLYDIIPGERGSSTWLSEVAASETAFADACATNTGALLEFVDTQSAARDLDLLRSVLGDAKLNFLGYSYGTYLGANFAELFPTKVGRLVLDGAVDPAASNADVNIAQAKGFESALRAYLVDCLSKTTCPFAGQSVDQAMQSIRAMLDQVEAEPIEAGDGRQLGANSLLTAIIYPLYSPDAWDALSKMFVSVQRGQADMAFRFADGYNGRNDDGTYGDNSTEAFRAINCLDYQYDPSIESMQAQRAALEAAAPVIGTFFAFGDIGCAVWPHQSRSLRTAVAANGSDPIVVIGTTNDPATPYQWAVNLSQQLSNATLITYQGEGHTAFNKSNACVDDAVNAYFINGTVPPAQLTC